MLLNLRLHYLRGEGSGRGYPYISEQGHQCFGNFFLYMCLDDASDEQPIDPLVDHVTKKYSLFATIKNKFIFFS
jgi:hypothetical protein